MDNPTAATAEELEQAEQVAKTVASELAQLVSFVRCFFAMLFNQCE